MQFCGLSIVLHHRFARVCTNVAKGNERIRGSIKLPIRIKNVKIDISKRQN